MFWFKSKKDVLIEQLVSQLSDSRLELDLERQKRVTAEELATSYRVRAETAEDYARRADEARNEAIKMLSDSLNQTTSRLLEYHINPEGPTPDPKSFTRDRMPLPSGKRVPESRKRFKNAQYSAMQTPIKPTVLEPKLNAEGKPTLGFREGMEALDLDKLVH